MILLLVLILCGGLLSAQVTTIPSNEQLVNSRTRINNNFTYLDQQVQLRALTTHNHTGVYAPLSHVHLIADLPTGTTGSTVALGNHTHAGVYAPLSHVHLISDITDLQASLDGKAASNHNHSGTYEPANANIQTHISSTLNPHSTTKAQVGLGNVDNTSDANKPISTATQTALDTKEPANSNIQAHISSTSNPHSVTKAQVGLGNVDNTADSAKSVASAAAVGGVTITGTPTSGQVPIASSGTAAAWGNPAGGLHTQNTDTGTTATSFQIDSGNSGCRWKMVAGVMVLRNAADSANCAMEASRVTSTGTGPGELTEEAAPSGSPASGTLYEWADSTNKGRWSKDASGNTYRDVRTGGPCNSTTGKMIGINNDGTPNCATDQTGGSVALIRQYGGKLIPTTDPTAYFSIPQDCTVIAWNIKVDAGTATVKFWKVAGGTALPTNSNSISTSGVSISTGQRIRSTTLTDFTDTTWSANDEGAVTITTSSGAAWVQAVAECQQ